MGQYTQYGVFRRYKIERWRSSKFGKKFTLCDGCVRQFKRPNPNQKSQKNVNVKLNINGAYPMQPGAIPMQQQQQPMSPPQAYTQPIAYQQPYVHGQNVQYQQQPIYQQAPQQNLYNTQPQNVYAQPMIVQQPQVQNESVSDTQSKKGGGIEIIKQGYMMKKGDLIKNWKKRYFVLKTNKILNYYESDNAVMVKGSCSLNKVKSVKKKSGQSFEIDTPKRKWCFACKDEKVRDEWVQAIKNVVAM